MLHLKAAAKGLFELSHMADKPNKPNSYAYMSNAGFELEGQNPGGTQIFAFEANEASDLKGSHNAVMPLNVAMPAAMQWSPGASAPEGIISVAGKESKMDVLAPYSGAPGGSNETMLSLELGKSVYFKVPGGSTSSLASQASGPSLPRKHRIAGQVPGCQVEGCKSDLTSAKEYHRRHKVCPMHSKAPRVIVRGEEQRFCQQCSRFHGLDAFDEGKRSCRNRLEGHNKRRRKPQPDPLGLTARFLPNFQDHSRLGQLFADRPSFLPHMRIPGVSTHWDDGNPTHQQKGSWQQQRMLTFDDQSAYECSVPAGAGIERQLFTGLYPQPNDRSTLFSPQSPKGMIPGSSDVGSGPKTHQYFQGSVNPLGPSLSLTSSSGAGVLSGLEAIPVGQGFPRVSDSGRALSLQSTMQFLSSTQGMVADITTHSSIITDQGLQSSHIPTAQPLVQGGGQHHHHFEWAANDKLLSAASSLQSLSSTTTSYQTGSMSIDKDHLEGPFAHGLNGVAGFDCVPVYSMFHGEVRLGDMSQDVKPTIDLMQVVTSASHGLNSQPLVSAGSFDLGVSHFQDLQALRSYEPPMDDSSQEM